MITMNELEWVCSDGGPLLVIPSELAVHWRGTSPPVGTHVPSGWAWGDGGVVCDYDRACNEEAAVSVGEFHYTWTVPIDAGRGLLLDGATSTTALPCRGGLVLFRDAPIETAEQANAILVALAPAAWIASPHQLEFRAGRLFVFDAAYPGAPSAAQMAVPGGVLDLPIDPGCYHVDQAAPGHPFETLALIRFVRTS